MSLRKALEQFEATLRKEPRRFRSLYGAAHAAQLSGSRDVESTVFSRTVECLCSLRQGRKIRTPRSAAIDFDEIACVWFEPDPR